MATGAGSALTAADCTTRPEAKRVDDAASLARLLRDAAADPPSLQAQAPPPYFTGPLPADKNRPVRLLLAVHGVGGNGADFAAPLVQLSQANGWLLVAPTFSYRDYNDALAARADEPLLLRQIEAILDDVPRKTGLKVQPQILALGFSRGAGTLQRFAMVHPGRLAAVALLSSGGYTLPYPCARGAAGMQELPFPIGTSGFERWLGQPPDEAGFRQLRTWLAVGSDDTDPPTPWDSLLGDTRLARTQAYADVMRQYGATLETQVVPNLAHEVTPAELREAVAFLRTADRP
ncbi:MAG: hypothetical protein JO247_16295 [Chloroflexi bacterium]|nr:hypothetical protein [Chloroflexota bacterium]